MVCTSHAPRTKRLTACCQSYYGRSVSLPVNPEDVWTRFAMSVFEVNGLIIRAGEGITNPLGQSSARWQVLGRAYEPTTVAKMAQDIGHARQSVQRIADVLAAEGLVSYEDNPTDRRARLLELTPDGAEVLSAIYQRQVEWSLRIMEKLSPTQMLRIANGLEGIAQVLKSSLDTGGERE
jgi:DNA-binding MarR family transcriptional regulator